MAPTVEKPRGLNPYSNGICSLSGAVDFVEDKVSSISLEVY